MRKRLGEVKSELEKEKEMSKRYQNYAARENELRMRLECDLKRVQERDLRFLNPQACDNYETVLEDFKAFDRDFWESFMTTSPNSISQGQIQAPSQVETIKNSKNTKFTSGMKILKCCSEQHLQKISTLVLSSLFAVLEEDSSTPIYFLGSELGKLFDTLLPQLRNCIGKGKAIKLKMLANDANLHITGKDSMYITRKYPMYY